MSGEPRRVAVGSDMRHPVAGGIADRLETAGYVVVRCGAVTGGTLASGRTPAADAGVGEAPDGARQRADETSATPWPDVAEQVARLVAGGAVDDGIVCCWTGTGVSIAANKVPGIRAALCGDAETARGARRWNDANVLALSLRATSAALAEEIVDAWLHTREVDASEQPNIDRVGQIERRYRERAVAHSVE